MCEKNLAEKLLILILGVQISYTLPYRASILKNVGKEKISTHFPLIQSKINECSKPPLLYQTIRFRPKNKTDLYNPFPPKE
jgi:hypothetical protein